MSTYKNKKGEIYTQEELEAAAKENGVDINTIIADNDLTIEGEPAGKNASVVAKEPTATQEKPKKKSASSSKVSSSVSNGKKYPWSNQSSEQTEGSFLGGFKKDKAKKQEAIEKETDRKIKEKQDQEEFDKALRSTIDYWNETNLREQAGLEPAPAPGSFSRKKFEQEQEIATKKASAKKEEEEKQVVNLKAAYAERELKYNKEASEFYKEATKNAELDDFEYADIDKYIATELERQKTGDEEWVTTTYGPGMARSELVKTPYTAFEKERKKIVAGLEKNNTLDDYTEDQISEMAAEMWKKNRVNEIKSDKYTRYLRDNTDISDKSKKILENYTSAKANKEALTFVESGIAAQELIKNQNGIIDQLDKIDSKLKPKGYKFTSQEEVDNENKLIEERNQLIGYYSNNNELYKTLTEKASKSAENVEDLNLAFDMYKRDYSTIGSLKRRGTKVLQWLNEGGGAVGYAFDFLVNSSMSRTGISPNTTYQSALTKAAAENSKVLDSYIGETFEKDLEDLNSVGEYIKHTGDLVLDFLPDLALMLLSGGESTVAKEASKQAAKKTLLQKTGSALMLGKETLPIGARVAGAKYLEMVNEQKYGYYNEAGEKIMPNYSGSQLMLVPAAYGYMEGLGEKATAGILKRNKRFFELAKKSDPGAWNRFGEGLLKKMNLDNEYARYALKGLKEMGRAQIEEQPAEFLTYVGQDLADKFLLGKEVNLLENTGTVFKDTGLLTLALSGAPVVAGLIIKPFMSQSTSQRLVDHSIKLAEIKSQLLNTDLTEIQKVELEKEIKGIEDNMNAIVTKTVGNIDAMPTSVFNAISASSSKIAALMNRATDINNSDLDQEKKKVELEALAKEYTAERLLLNSMTRSIENVNTFGKAINNIAKGQLIKLAVDRITTQFDKELSADEKTSRLQALDTKVEKIYQENDINIDEERAKEYEQNLKVAQKLATAANVSIVEGNTSEDLLNRAKALLDAGEITESDFNSVKQMVKDKAEGLFSENGKVLFIDKNRALETKAVTVGSHEFLHKLLFKTLQNADTQVNIGEALRDYLAKSNPDFYLNDRVFGRLFANYGDATKGVQNEELLTLFSDALLKGEIKYNENVFTKIGDILRRFFQDLGLVDIKFNSGIDVYNFIKDYNNTIAKDKDLGKAMKKVLEKGAEGKLMSKEGEAVAESKASKSIEERMDDLEEQLMSGEIDIDIYESKMAALEKEEYDLSKKKYEEKKAEVQKVAKEPSKKEDKPDLKEISAKTKAKLDAIGNDPKGFNKNNPAIYSTLEGLIRSKAKTFKTASNNIVDLRNLPGFDMDNMISETMANMIPYIAKFDPAKNDSLYGYINAQLNNRMRAALKSGKVTDADFTEDVTEMKKLSEEDAAPSTPTLPERQRYQNILESGVFAPEVIDQVRAKMLPIIRTLKSKIDEKVSINKTVVPFIAEILQEMGKQADIDIKKAMGGKEGGALKKFLLDNKKAILENMTTTWLMGKDNGKTVLGGMPFAIQKRVNGQWLSFPDWIGKKVDRESVNTDLAGRTAGHEMVRRLPNAAKNISDEVFVDSIIDPVTGVSIRGRKESLAKAMAEELSMDVLSDDLANGGALSAALQRNQELLGAAVEKVMEQEFNRLAERGNVKYSISNEEITAALKHLIDKGSFNAALYTLKEEYNPFRNLYNKLTKGALTDEEISSIFERYNEVLDKVAHRKHEKLMAATVANILSNTVYNSKVFGGNNSYKPDLLIGTDKKIDKNSVTNVVVEMKKNIFARMTSATMLVVRTKYANTDWGKALIEAYDSFYNTDLFNEIGKYLDGKTAKGGAYNITNVKAVGALLEGKKTVAAVNLPADAIIDINNNKSFVNDLLIVGTSLTDYFGPDFFDTYDLIPGSNIISAQVELKIEKGKYLRPRVIFYIDKEIAKNINKIASGRKIENLETRLNNITKAKRDAVQSRSIENNLNLNDNFDYNIDLVSNYIKDNNIRRINSEDSFELLDSLRKRVEDFWGILPNNVIEGMYRSIDYAVDVIEDREGDSFLMQAMNEGLNLETVKNAEKQLNEFVKNNANQKPLYSKSLDFEFNKMLEENTGVEEFTKISDIVAKRTGRTTGRFSFFVPPSADDFVGLTSYMFAGKGAKGEADQEFFERNLVIPYTKGVNALDSVRQSIKKAYDDLLKRYPDIRKKLEKLTPDKQFTYDQAIRVYLWGLGGVDVPGLSRADKGKLVYFVKQDPDLVAFARELSITGRQNRTWIEPSATWDSETIISDLHNITEGDGRKKWLREFIENADAIFSKENLNKIEYIYGTSVRSALEDSLYRMKNGKSRPAGTDAITNRWMNWINGATAGIMFFNTRSALLQTISMTNFINFSDNNPYKAAKAFANQKQYWADFAYIINSDKLKERRSGLKSDVTQAEIANAANSATNKFSGIISYLQKIGFTPTQAADSFAIALGGATFYRNRVNTYLKNGYDQATAEEAAWTDFSIATDKSQQSSDPMYISKQQTTSLGRLVLAFANTPMQYNRIIKKAALDIVNRRGSVKENMSKIIYYGFLQNLIFSALQAALFMPFDDEDEDLEKMTKEQRKEYDKLKKKQDDKTKNLLNGMLDTVLRGSGVYGAVIATVKNVIMEYQRQEERELFADHAYTVLAGTSVSPPISSKLRKLYAVHRTSKFEKDVIQERGWEVTRDGRLNLSPKYDMVGGFVSATTNIPLDRIVEKTNNIAEVLDERNTKLQRTALALGWKDWELNVKNEEHELIKAKAKVKRKEEGIKKAIATKKAKKEAEEKAFEALPKAEQKAYRRQKAKEKREKSIERRKKKIEEIKLEKKKRLSKRKMG